MKVGQHDTPGEQRRKRVNLKVAQAIYRALRQLGSHSEILFQTYKQCNKIP